MTCETARALLHPYADGELDVMRSLEFEEHLSGCAECAREVAATQALRSAIRETAEFYPAPERLQTRIRAIAGEEPAPDAERDVHLPSLGWLMIAAAAAVALLGVWLKGEFSEAPDATQLIAREVVADHVRSLMVDHLTDVPSSDQHTVKPWFEGKIDFSPLVRDLSAKGFPLVGGRLDFLDNRPVAAIVYKRRAHMINLFVWPVPQAADSPPSSEVRDGYNIAHWTRSGMTYWAVSSLNAAELLEFAADLAGTSTPPASAGPPH